MAGPGRAVRPRGHVRLARRAARQMLRPPGVHRRDHRRFPQAVHRVFAERVLQHRRASARRTRPVDGRRGLVPRDRGDARRPSGVRVPEGRFPRNDEGRLPQNKRAV